MMRCLVVNGFLGVFVGLKSSEEADVNNSTSSGGG
jgi:hypothetical protein